MSFAEVKAKVEVLSETDQEKLAAYLTYLKRRRDPAFRQELKESFSDRHAENWIVAEVPGEYKHPERQ